MPKKGKKAKRQPANVPLPETPSTTADTDAFSPSSPSYPYTPADPVRQTIRVPDTKDIRINSLLDPCYNSDLPRYLPLNITFCQLLDPSEAVLTKIWEAVATEYVAATRDKNHRYILGQARRLDPHWPHVKPRALERKDAKISRALTAHAIRFATTDVLNEWIFDVPSFPPAKAPAKGSSGIMYGLQSVVQRTKRIKEIGDRLLDQKDPLRAMNGYFLALLALLPYTPADASMMTYHQAVFTGLPQLEYDLFVCLHRCCAEIPSFLPRPMVITYGGLAQWFEIFPEGAFLTLAQRRHCLELNIEYIMIHRDLFALQDLLRAVTARARMHWARWHWDDPGQWVHRLCCGDRLGDVIILA